MPESRPVRPLNEIRIFPIQNVTNDSDADSLKGDYGTTPQFEVRNQLYTQTATGSSLDSGGIYSTKSSQNDAMSRFQDEFAGLNVNNGSAPYGNRNPNFYSSLARSSPYSYSSRSNYGSAPSPYGRDTNDPECFKQSNYFQILS